MKNNYTKEQKSILIVSLLASFITTYMGSALNLSIPHIEKTFNTGASQIGWIVTIYILTCGALALPVGKVADIISKNNIMKGGLLIFATGSLGGIVANSMRLLLISRFVQAIGASMIFSTNNAVLSETFAGKERQKILGFVTGATYVGMAAGPVLGGVFDYYIGWKYIFIFAAAVSMISFLISLKIPFKKSNYLVHNKWDTVGTVLYIAGICLLMYGISSVGERMNSIIFIEAGVSILVLFFRRERVFENPLLDMNLIIHNKRFLFSNMNAMIIFGALFAVNYLLSLYLQTVKEYTSQEAGLILTSLPISLAMVSVLGGKKINKKAQLNCICGIILCAAGMGAGVFINDDSSVIYIILLLISAGVGQALFAVSNINTVMESVSKEEYGVASSVYAGVRSLGNTISMALVTIIVSTRLGDMQLTQTDPIIMIEIVNICFFVFAIGCIAGIFIALRKKV
ncbi:MAG: MFS transporter [Firmicutes bacterium]|nr:MFS transporter [Bacillota bacterium]